MKITKISLQKQICLMWEVDLFDLFGPAVAYYQI